MENHLNVSLNSDRWQRGHGLPRVQHVHRVHVNVKPEQDRGEPQTILRQTYIDLFASRCSNRKKCYLRKYFGFQMFVRKSREAAIATTSSRCMCPFSIYRFNALFLSIHPL